MLPKKKRFTRRSFPTGHARVRHTYPWGSVSVYPADAFKASVVVSKKTLRKATDRNRLTRRVYAALAPHSATPVGVIVYPRREALTAPHRTLVADLARALE